MHPEFGIAREEKNYLYYMEYENDSGAFHFHSQIELYFVEEGEMEVTVNNRKTMLKGGQMSVSLGYDAHAYKTPEHSRSSVFIIPAFMCKDFLSAVAGKKVSDPFITDVNTVKKIREYILQLLSHRENSIMVSGLIYIILGTIMESISFEKSDKPADTDLASHLLFYINENYKRDISLDVLSREFGFTKSYISRYFKDCFGIGITRYINILRLKNAVVLLEEEKNNITYCALESGFNSLRTFYRVFSEEFGCTPKEYIK